MNYISIILKAAKSAHVSGVLLLAICNTESGGFRHTYSANDHGSPSYGMCQLKKDTASMLGFKGTREELMKPEVNATYAALYLKYQQDRYGDDWLKLASSYNAGSYVESSKFPGFPKNYKYVKLVRQYLPPYLKHKLSVDDNFLARNYK